MSNPEVCFSCKPSNSSESHVPKYCEIEYQTVDDCMKNNKGSISACKQEWSTFRICFEGRKLNKSSHS